MSETFNTFDLIFIALSLLFIVVSFFRGFVKEIFSLLIWIISLYVSHIGAPFLAKALSSYSHNKVVLDIVSLILLFVFSFLILIFSTANLADDLKDKMPTILDRSLAILYGIIKALLIFGVFYATLANLYGFLLGKKQNTESKKVPNWLIEAKCGNILKISGSIVDPAVKSFVEVVTKNFDQTKDMSKALDDKIDEAVDTKDSKTDDKKSEKSSDKKDKETLKIEKETGYNKRDIDKMNRLIDVVDKINN